MSDALKSLIIQLLDCNSPGRAKPVVDQLIVKLCELTELDLHPALFLDRDATLTAQGKAVSPTTAAQCAEDIERTRVFLKGVHECITERLHKNANAPVKILYAGTGPFGLLLVPLLPLFELRNIRVTLLDIHQESLDKVTQVIEHLNVSDCIHAMHCADACEWQTQDRFDIIISETMKHGLVQEPQVSVFAHLQQFLVADGLLIPEQIRLDLWLGGYSFAQNVTQENEPIFLGKVFELNKDTARQLGAHDESCLRGSLQVPDYSRDITDLKLTTFIRVYGDHALQENQSQLTLPIYEKGARPVPGTTLNFHYEMGHYPQCVFEYQQLPAIYEMPLPEIKQASRLGIFHLPRLWHKTQLRKYPAARAMIASVSADEWLLDRLVLDNLGVGLEPAMQQLFSTRSADEFEAWVQAVNGGDISAQLIERTNSLVINFLQNNSKAVNVKSESVLTEAQRNFWQEHGYVIIPGVLDADECRNARNAVWEFLEMRENDPATWYNTAAMQKIMVQLFRHPALEVARQKPEIRKIFNELWQRDDLMVTTDRVSFNPPETETWHFPGPHLHWDVELKAPIPFGTQGLIYLTDVAENQGAFSCVPGFHKQIDNWLENYSGETDPGQQDWSRWPVKPIAANAGDLIIWHHALPHGSSPNQAQLPRIVQYLNMYA